MKPNRPRPYDQTVFRVSENYLMPDQEVGGISREAFEHLLAECGVDARWIGVVDHGGPRFESKFIPLSIRVKGDLTEELKRWADVVHEEGMTAMTWCPIPHCEAGWAARPEWRVAYLGEAVNPKCDCCVNTSYGDALIGMALEIFEKFGLDGIWFDGATLTSITGLKVPGCVCRVCRDEFESEMGRRTPTAVDFTDPGFRAWVAWRFEKFTAYLKRLVDTIHGHHPDKAIAINHYHRYRADAWHTACPLDLYDCDIITGGEAMMDTVHASLSSKMTVAYGRPAEVWTPIARWRMGEMWQCHEPAALLHHAARCVTFGAFPAFGFETDVPAGSMPSLAESFLKPAAEFLRTRARYVHGASANPVALHLSQQAETFFFGGQTRPVGFGWYWNSLFGWDELLNETGLGTDAIFDGHLTAERLRRYRVVILPLSVCLSDRQAGALAAYVRDGGTLVLGPWAGRLDARGEPWGDDGVLADLRSATEGAVPRPDEFVRTAAYLRNDRLHGVRVHGLAVNTMLAEQTAKPGSEVLASVAGKAAISRRRLGAGFVFDLAGDLGSSFYYAPSSPLRKTLVALLEEITVFPVIVKGPPTVSTALRRMADGVLLVHLHHCPATVHHQGYGSGEEYMPIIPRDVIPACDVRIEIRGLQPRRAERLVERQGLVPIERQGDVSLVRLDRLDLHEIVAIA